MKNKLLILIIIILLPISILIKNDVADNIVLEEDNSKSDIVVHLNNNNEIINLSLNDYLIGVVGQEMPASFNIEALKAQAVAARTFAYNNLNNNEINISSSAQSYANNTTLINKWKEDYDKYRDKITSAVLATENEVIKYNDRVIKSYYYAISNGKTEDAQEVFNEELPYLTIVDSSFDKNVNNFEVKTTFNYDNFCNLLNINPCKININTIVRDDSNRVTSININDKNYSGIEIRKILSLRSTDFNIVVLNDNIEITTRGYGHGVGMSQYGANYLATSGYDYQKILTYFYKDTKIENY